MKLKNKIIGLLLVFCLAAGLVPTVAFAADGGKTIMSGTSGIKDPTATSNDQGTYYAPNSYIYFGTVSYTHLDVYKRQPFCLI